MIKELNNKYVANQQEITRRRNIIERHQAQIEKIRDKSWWGDILIAPIMEVIREKFPQLTWSDRMATMGFNCRVPMFGKNGNDIIASVTFRPADLTKGEISFETGELKYQTKGYDAHGDNLKTEIVTDIEQIIDHIQKQIDAKK